MKALILGTELEARVRECKEKRSNRDKRVSLLLQSVSGNQTNQEWRMGMNSEKEGKILKVVGNGRERVRERERDRQMAAIACSGGADSA